MRPVMTMAPIWEGNKRTGFRDLREGRFHQWAGEYEEFESGPGNYTVALVEYADGSIGTVMPDCVRFLDSQDSEAENLRGFITEPLTT